MPRSSRPSGSPWGLLVGLLALALPLRSPSTVAQEPPSPATPPNPAGKPDEVGEAIKPLAAAGYPDDPPPHEGAMIDDPIVIEPPDILVVEAVQGLPGRPITGERLVRSDGTISLGFYGSVHVSGLTLEEAKIKIIFHLRRYLSDEVLGLVYFQPDESQPSGHDKEAQGEVHMPKPAPPGDVPAEAPAPPVVPEPNPNPAQPRPVAPQPSAPPQAIVPGQASPGGGRRSVTRRVAQVVVIEEEFARLPLQPARPPIPESETKKQIEGFNVEVEPQLSTHVFVDITGHNSKVYYVQGEVTKPGRIPLTGQETVLDALNYSGGLLENADSVNIHVYRPARGDKPIKDYPIDYPAIMRGEAKANLQLFPNDRLVVGRKGSSKDAPH